MVERHNYQIFKKKEENTFKKKKPQRGKNIVFEENIFFIYHFSDFGKKGETFCLENTFFGENFF